jgi:hypothetical protein
MYEAPRIAVEVISAILFFILVRFMMKPYALTREGRYLGLPLGFAFLGTSEIILAAGIIQPNSELMTLSVVTRTFSFVFLSATYYYSKRPAKNTRLFWDITLSLIIVVFATLCLLLIIAPQFDLQSQELLGSFLRILGLSCISYICIHTIKNHAKSPNPTTILIPFGYVLLGMSQYSQLIRVVDENYAYGLAFVGGLAFRLLAIAVFIFVSYRSFYVSKK